MNQSHIPVRRGTTFRYGAAVGSVALAVIARTVFDPQLHNGLPFAPFLAGVVLAAWLGGLGPALLSMALGLAAAEWFFVRRGTGGWSMTRTDVVVAVGYCLVASAVALMSHSMHKASETAIARQIELEREIGERIRAEEALRSVRDDLADRVRDRTVEVKRAHARLSEQAALLQLAHDAILVRDFRGEITFWNRGAEETYGWPRGEAIGRIAHQLLQTTSLIPLDEIDVAILERGQWEGELTHVTRSGHTVVVASRCSLQRDQDGKPRAVLEINRDVTVRKHADRILAERTEELANSNAELQQFAYVASHDLQEPLRMVSSFTQLLADRYGDKLDQDAKEFIGYAVEGAARMQALIQDLLALSRIGTRGRGFEVVRLDESMGRAVANLRLAIQESGACVSHEALPAVLADPSQMVQLLQNLIANGVKFKGVGAPAVHISAVLTGDDWTFSVRDNGIGFEPQYSERIFAVFQRLHSRDEYPGTGMGLAICRKIVERHQGRIWAQSAPGTGSTFFFTVPAGGVPAAQQLQAVEVA